MRRAVTDETASEKLKLTGERTLPGIPEENYWFQRHVIAYRFAGRLVRGGAVLDAGCGEGYGTEMLAGDAASVVGLDLEPDVIDQARARYPHVRFEVADLLELPFPEAHFDGVVTLQVIEHLHRPIEFISEIARVLKPGGTLVLATPNRLTFSPEGIRNPFHTVEFAPADLRAVLEPKLHIERLAGTFHGARLRLIETLTRGSFWERQIAQPVPEWPGWLRRAVASVRPEDFRIRDARVDRSLDLIAVARR
jgi:SAM-dependent methyltransferase